MSALLAQFQHYRQQWPDEHDTTHFEAFLEQGPRVFTRLGVAEDKRVSEKRMDEIAVALHDHLADLDTGR